MIKAFLYNTRDTQKTAYIWNTWAAMLNSSKNSIYLEYMGGNAEFFSVRADPDDYFQN